MSVMQDMKNKAISALVSKKKSTIHVMLKFFICSSSIIACSVGEYRSVLNSSCVACPANSTSKEAEEHCTCIEGHYRATAYEGIGVQCTG